MTLAGILDQVTERLEPWSDSARLDAQVLLAAIIRCSRAWVLAHPKARLTPEQQQQVQQALARLEAGEPLPYVLGRWEFYGLEMEVTPAVLIPRPETEGLVERALTLLEERPALVADVGTGSGCIAVALAVHRPAWQVMATDRSRPALHVARRNAQRHGVAGRVHLVQTDLLASLSGPFDLICANLPYIPTADLADLAVARCEPRLALDGGADGLALIRRLLAQAEGRLRQGGWVLLEIEYRQGERVAHLAQQFFPQARVQVFPDLGGHPRVVAIRL